MALVSLSSDIEERREAALAEIGRLKSEIELASAFAPSDAHRLHERCQEILEDFQHLAEKFVLRPEEESLRLVEIEHQLRQSSERADVLQSKLDQDSSRSARAVDDANRRAAAKDSELGTLKRKFVEQAAAAKIKIGDLEGRLNYWRKIAQGEVLRYEPGPKHPQPGKPYRKPRAQSSPRKGGGPPR